jgi:hypothetical protein
VRTAFLTAIALTVSGAGSLFAQDPATPEPAFAELGCPAVANRESDARLQVLPEYLLWWTKDGPVPGPLVTTGSPSDPRPGALGMPGTVVLYGGSGIDYRLHSGGRLTVDWWLGDGQTIGIEVRGFVLETHTASFGIDSNKAGAPVIARPFVNAQTGLEDAEVVTAPGAFLGGIDVFSDSRLWGGEANALARLYRGDTLRADLLAGFRYLGLDENIRLSQSSTLLALGTAGFFGAPVPPPDIISITDRFNTRNEFYGGQLGVRGQWCSGRWSVDLLGKVALGATHQSVNIEGDTKRTGSDGVTVAGPGGVLALASNSGLSSRNRFSFAPEVGAHVGFQISRHLTARVGYTFLYWDHVARPGNEMNLVVNPALIPSSVVFGTGGQAQPARVLRDSDFWAQGLDFGLEFRY